MAGTFAKDFDEIVELEDGFLPGGSSYIITGKDVANYNADIAVCCLARAGYGVYRTTPQEIVRRLQHREVLTDDQLDRQWQDASCYFIFGLFEPDIRDTLTEHEWGVVTWFITEAHQGGNIVVIPINRDDADLDMYGKLFGDFIEKLFERIDNGTKTKRKKR